eukprot:jgi/Galph1/2313/GphlegSOOS_G1003.1
MPLLTFALPVTSSIHFLCATDASHTSEPLVSSGNAVLPDDFQTAVTEAFKAAQSAIQRGHRLIEIDFPPLSSIRLSSPDCGAYEVLDANRYHAVQLAKLFATHGENQVAIGLPDSFEYERVIQMSGSDDPVIFPGVRWTVVKPSYKGSAWTAIWVKREKLIPLQPQENICILIGMSTQELTAVEKLVQSDTIQRITFILFNLQLDNCRNDLGLLGFPSKNLHYRFLCQFLPAYYLKSRSFVQFLNQEPFVLKYEGALFRSYPDDWQILLQTGNSNTKDTNATTTNQYSYRLVEKLKKRPTGVQFRKIVTQALQLKESLRQKLVREQEKKSKEVWWEQDEEKSISQLWKC